MRIGVGLHLLAPDNGGVTNYALTLLRLWPLHAPEHPMVLFSFDHNDALLDTLPPATRRHEIRMRTQEDALAHCQDIDVYFCPFGTLWPRPFPKPSVLTFHDMQERFHPEHFTDAEKAERFFHYDWSLRMADSVIAVSQFTKAMAVSLARISGDKCHVVHHVPDELPPPQRPARFPFGERPFVFYPANLWKHKNHATLVAAMDQVCAADPDLSLVCTGSFLNHGAQWEQWVSDSRCADRMAHLGRLTRPEISWLYRNARALVFPSLFEGFGIPLIEAMQAGCPVACASNTSQPEVAGEAALYFDAENPSSIAAAILRISRDPALRTRLQTLGAERIRRYSVLSFIDGHLRAFRDAITRHTAARSWLNRNVRLPHSLVPRTRLGGWERRRAARLLLQSKCIPPGALSVES
ncbi:MAG: glycosyltransferase family 4 protein [Opitutaceae bacterium]|nr:glycosyltransferase family 4 protein [Opitutaceae bacterium]